MTTDNTPSDPTPGADPSGDGLELADRQYGIYQCNDCENVALTLREVEEGMLCHGEPMEEVTEVSIDVRPPDVKEVLLDAFGLPKPGLDICLCVIGEGPTSSADVAEQLGYDETTVRRYMNELVDIGLLQKSQLNREGGGVVNVYHSIDITEMRTDTLIGFYAWAGEAARLIEQANLTKAEYLDEDYSEGLNEIFWEQFDSDS